MPPIAHVTDATFETEVLSAPRPILVDFYADWCGPCRALMPALEDIAREYGGELSVVKLNVDDNVATRDRFEIANIPTLLLFDKGALRQRIVGPPSRIAIAAAIDSVLGGAT